MKLDINKLTNGNINNNIKIGELNIDVIKLLSLDLNPQNIYLWPSRLEEHCSKHKDEYSSPQSYYKAIESIPEILDFPDYVGLHSNGNILYIKKIDDISLVGLKVLKKSGGLLFRTIYPITEDKLKSNIRSGKYIKLKEDT